MLLCYSRGSCCESKAQLLRAYNRKHITKEVFENFESFKKLHPAYNNITKESLLDGLSAPMHEGAKKYFKDADKIILI